MLLRGDRVDNRCAYYPVMWLHAARLSITALVVIALAGCAGGAVSLCESAGGTYAGGTCSGWGPRQDAEQRMCDMSGGVYLAGQGECAFGMGGP
jgi:hypothetical protein